MSYAAVKENFVQRKRDEKMRSLKWDKPLTSRGGVKNGNADVSITIINNGKAKSQLNFIFRNEVEKLICNGELEAEGIYRLSPCIDGNRVYFAAFKDGYKIVTSPKKSTVTFKMTFLKKYENYLGDYELQYDQSLDLYYIQKEAQE